MEEAPASLSTETDATSAGFNNEMSCVGIPSTTYKGSLLRKEENPLILTFEVTPGWPLPVTVMPDALPCKRLLTLPAGIAVSCAGSTIDTEPVRFFLSCSV